MLQHIPSIFATTYFTKKQGEAILQDSEGRTWPVEYGFNLGKASFRSRCMTFASDNNLEVGDCCVFELIEVTKPQFKVVELKKEAAAHHLVSRQSKQIIKSRTSYGTVVVAFSVSLCLIASQLCVFGNNC